MRSNRKWQLGGSHTKLANMALSTLFLLLNTRIRIILERIHIDNCFFNFIVIQRRSLPLRTILLQHTLLLLLPFIIIVVVQIHLHDNNFFTLPLTSTSRSSSRFSCLSCYCIFRRSWSCRRTNRIYGSVSSPRCSGTSGCSTCIAGSCCNGITGEECLSGWSDEFAASASTSSSSAPITASATTSSFGTATARISCCCWFICSSSCCSCRAWLFDIII
mmetsp:Transcript_10724/g.17716  ORF Transcript_10724/g.17716 Transcript_10724/m.17716 type:complete len:218 (+) Transcript_10724:566-1219(+)